MARPVHKHRLGAHPISAITQGLVWDNARRGSEGRTRSQIFQNHQELLWNRLHGFQRKMFLICRSIFQRLGPSLSPYHFLPPLNPSILWIPSSLFFLLSFMTSVLFFPPSCLLSPAFQTIHFTLFSGSLSLPDLHLQTLIHRTPAQERHPGFFGAAPKGYCILANPTYTRN